MPQSIHNSSWLITVNPNWSIATHTNAANKAFIDKFTEVINNLFSTNHILEIISLDPSKITAISTVPRVEISTKDNENGGKAKKWVHAHIFMSVDHYGKGCRIPYRKAKSMIQDDLGMKSIYFNAKLTHLRNVNNQLNDILNYINKQI